jgi:hypothetical protein
MKRLLALLVFTFALVGCATAPGKVEPSVVVQYKLVTAPIPEESLVIPANVEPINLATATQKDVADWLARSEGRTKDLETKLRLIKANQDKQKEVNK